MTVISADTSFRNCPSDRVMNSESSQLCRDSKCFDRRARCRPAAALRKRQGKGWAETAKPLRRFPSIEGVDERGDCVTVTHIPWTGNPRGRDSLSYKESPAC